MDFVDKTVVELADEATRANVFDQYSLVQLLDAAYDTRTWPGRAIHRRLRRLSGSALRPARSARSRDLERRRRGRSEPRRAFVSPGRSAGSAAVDAVWRGPVVARFRRGGEPITSVGIPMREDHTIEATITFDCRAVSETPRPLPIAVALLIGRGLFALSELLAEIEIVRDAPRRSASSVRRTMGSACAVR